jgi:hypothetical protein
VLESLVVGDTEAPWRHRSSLEMPNLPSYVYIGDLCPTELIIPKQFNSMLRIQSPPYSCDSNNIKHASEKSSTALQTLHTSASSMFSGIRGMINDLKDVMLKT